MKYQQEINLKNHSGMYIGGVGKYSTFLKSEEEILDIVFFAKENKLKTWIIGDGTNTIFSENIENVFFVINKIKEIETIQEDENSILIEVGAGENWDSFVEYSIKNNYSGIEALSFIPGTVGATPIQNVGAYGVEVKDVIDSVRVFDKEKEKFHWMKNKDCEFEYRNSIFKKNPDAFIVTKVRFILSKKEPSIPNYPDIQNYFDNGSIEFATLKEIRDAIISTRKAKLLDYKEVPNCGSFFANPIVNEVELKKLKEMYPDIKEFQQQDNKFKISAGWLIDKAGLKGKSFGDIYISEKHALILCNPERKASFDNIEKAEKEIKETIKEMFGVDLLREPVICE